MRSRAGQQDRRHQRRGDRDADQAALVDLGHVRHDEPDGRDDGAAANSAAAERAISRLRRTSSRSVAMSSVSTRGREPCTPGCVATRSRPRTPRAATGAAARRSRARRSRHAEARDQAPALVLDRLDELDALRLQLGAGGVHVGRHQEDLRAALLAPRDTAGAGVAPRARPAAASGRASRRPGRAPPSRSRRGRRRAPPRRPRRTAGRAGPRSRARSYAARGRRSTRAYTRPRCAPSSWTRPARPRRCRSGAARSPSPAGLGADPGRGVRPQPLGAAHPARPRRGRDVPARARHRGHRASSPPPGRRVRARAAGRGDDGRHGPHVRRRLRRVHLRAGRPGHPVPHRPATGRRSARCPRCCRPPTARSPSGSTRSPARRC